MKVAGIIALARFPLWRKSFDALSSICDSVYVRFDGLNGDPEILQELVRIYNTPESRLRRIDIVKKPWQCPEWREDCLRMLDPEPPDIVLCPDEDEVFDDTIVSELQEFWKSDKLGMMFSYHPLETADGRTVNHGMPYPPTPHMKAYKWQKLLCYYPYHGDGIIARYRDKSCHWMAQTKIRHYAAFTKALEAGKNWRSNTPTVQHEKAVTLVGFGPSSQKLKAIGEVWSLNNCYDSFDTNLMRNVTRIYEMHKEEKRNRELAKDGNLHFWHLDQLGFLGHRIVMQKVMPQIRGSEAFPLMDVQHRFPFGYFHGTPPYMVAHAIMDGYNHIRCFGFDQLDYEHRKQRECFAFWIAIAFGLGIKVSGAFTFMEEDKRLYGYDYGPEWDDESNRIFWNAFPFEIKMKIPSRAMKGELYDGDR